MPILILQVVILMVIAYALGSVLAWLLVRAIYDPIEDVRDDLSARVKKQGANNR